MTNPRPEPPVLTSGGRRDPLQEVFGKPSTSPTAAAPRFISPPPRFHSNGGGDAAGPIRPTATPLFGGFRGPPVASAVAPFAMPQGTAQPGGDASEFTRSEIAQRIRQSFDALVKASPIGAPLTMRRFSAPTTSAAYMPQLQPPQLPGAFQSPPTLLGAGTSMSGGVELPGHHVPAQPQQSHTVHEIRRTVHSLSPTYEAFTSAVRVVRQVSTSHVADPGPEMSDGFVCEEVPPADHYYLDGASAPPHQRVALPLEGVTDGAEDQGQEVGNAPDGQLLNKPTPAVLYNAPQEQQQDHDHVQEEAHPDRRPRLQETKPSTSRPSSQQHPPSATRKNKSSSSGARRELAGLLSTRGGGGAASASPLHGGMMETTPAATLLAVHSARKDEPVEEQTVEVSRFGRPKLKPMAWWSSERLVGAGGVAGFKDGAAAAGPVGIDRGSTLGDLLFASPAEGSTPQKRGKGRLRTSSGISNKQSKTKDRLQKRGTARGSKKKQLLEASMLGSSDASRGGASRLSSGNVVELAAATLMDMPPAGRTTPSMGNEELQSTGVNMTLAALAAAAGAEAAAKSAREKTTDRSRSVSVDAADAPTANDVRNNHHETVAAPDAHAQAENPLPTQTIDGGIPPKTIVDEEEPVVCAIAPATSNLPGGDPTASTTGASVLLPEIPGVPPDVVAALATLPPHERPKKCGRCKPCQKPSLRKACEVIRALGGNPARPRGKNRILRLLDTSQQPRNDQQPPTTSKALRSAPCENPPLGDDALDGSDHATRVGNALDTKMTADDPNCNNTTNKGEAGEPQREIRKRRAAAAALDVSGDEPNPIHKQQQQQQQRPVRQRAMITFNEDDSDEDGAQDKGDGNGGTADGGKNIWTEEQIEQLHRAWVEVPATAPNFWHKVATLVSEKTAADCFNKMFESHPTPRVHGNNKKATAAAGSKSYLTKDGSTKEFRVPATKAATQNAARQFARRQRWQKRAEEVAAVNGDESELMEAMEEQQQRDKYIDQILRKRRGRALGVAGRPAKGAVLPVVPAPRLAVKKDGDGSLAVEHVKAALAAEREDPDKESGEESDYYWSDAE